jgi:hypothetical protein
MTFSRTRIALATGAVAAVAALAPAAAIACNGAPRAAALT